MSADRPTPSDEGAAPVAISNLVVRLMNEYTGRGAGHARTTIDGDLVICVLRDILTKGERSLIEDGQDELVLRMRRAFQQTMRLALVAGVEAILGRTVVAFMSDNTVDPDIAVEIFILQ